jgi:BTB/POZ domain
MPPDVVVEVGPPPFTRFAAHSALLSLHSGYLRAALRTEDGHLKRYDTPVFLPNITADQFSPLLTYMYTGFLDLTVDNIFGVLLATHVLHMPRALELCRSFLARTQAEGYLGGSVLHEKPIASKVIRPIASRATETGLRFIAPPTSHVLLATTGTPFKSIHQIAERLETSSPVASTSTAPVGGSPKANPPPPKKVKLVRREKPRRKTSVTLEAATAAVPISEVKSLASEDDKVIIDIASCDGPVRFCRVLNDAYGGGVAPTSGNPPPSLRSHHTMSTSFHAQMARTISERRGDLQHSSGEEESENSQDNCQKPSTSGATGDIYTCVYCNHTFKSQYCYQKHAKRHLNPQSLQLDSTDSNASSAMDDKLVAAATNAQQIKIIKHPGALLVDANANQILKREVRPLDMNVQYYPCKTCGSKFPSYYFVHKHRKMCHADEEQAVLSPAAGQPQTQ